MTADPSESDGSVKSVYWDVLELVSDTAAQYDDGQSFDRDAWFEAAIDFESSP